jgi:hypothetical protein
VTLTRSGETTGDIFAEKATQSVCAPTPTTFTGDVPTRLVTTRDEHDVGRRSNYAWDPNNRLVARNAYRDRRQRSNVQQPQPHSSLLPASSAGIGAEK